MSFLAFGKLYCKLEITNSVTIRHVLTHCFAICRSTLVLNQSVGTEFLNEPTDDNVYQVRLVFSGLFPKAAKLESDGLR